MIVHMRQTADVADLGGLSSLDRAIIARLQIDGRVPYSVIAMQLSVAESTIQRRVEQLTDEGFFKIVGMVNPFHPGDGQGALIGLSTDAAQMLTIAKTVADIPEVRFAAVVTGTFDVVCEVVTSARANVRKIMTTDLALIPGVRTMNSSWILETHKTDFLWDGESVERTGAFIYEPTRMPERARTSALDLDELDEGIVDILRDRGRTSYVEIAAQLNTTVSTARRRTLRLLESGYLEVVALGDPHRLGYDDVVLLWIKVTLSQVQSVLAQLRAERAVWYLTRVAGTADIVAGALFRDSQALRAFLDGPLAAIDGIREIAVSLELATYKRSYVRYD